MIQEDGRRIPAITTAEMREVDRLMVEEYRISLLQMMENAGRHLARFVVSRFLGSEPVGKQVVVLVGPGGNGGGALVAARRLRSWGVDVEVYLARPEAQLRGVPTHQASIARRVGCVIDDSGMPAEGAHVVVDGLVGYSLQEVLTGRSKVLAEWANEHAVATVSLDVPSGLDATTGRVGGVAIAADATLTLALPKTGLLVDGARSYVGELHLADIGVPPELYEALGIRVSPLFAGEEILRMF